MVAVRVLIVDDHEPFRLWAGKVLRAGGMDVAGEAETGLRAVELATELRPDVVLLDVRLPDLDGFAVCRRLDEAGIAVVLCSTRDYGERAAGGPALGSCRRSGCRPPSYGVSSGSPAR